MGETGKQIGPAMPGWWVGPAGSSGRLGRAGVWDFFEPAVAGYERDGLCRSQRLPFSLTFNNDLLLTLPTSNATYF